MGKHDTTYTIPGGDRLSKTRMKKYKQVDGEEMAPKIQKSLTKKEKLASVAKSCRKLTDMFKEKIDPSDDKKDDVHDGFKDNEIIMVMTVDPVTPDQDNSGHGADASNYDEAVTSIEVRMLIDMKTRRLLDIDNGMKNLSLSC